MQKLLKIASDSKNSQALSLSKQPTVYDTKHTQLLLHINQLIIHNKQSKEYSIILGNGEALGIMKLQKMSKLQKN